MIRDKDYCCWCDDLERRCKAWRRCAWLSLLACVVVYLIGCTAPPATVEIDDAFVMCVCMQQQLASAEKSTVELKASVKLSNADVVALYTLYEPAISKVWAAMGGGATMRDAVTEWLKTNGDTRGTSGTGVKKSPAEFELPKSELKSTDFLLKAASNKAADADSYLSQPLITDHATAESDQLKSGASSDARMQEREPQGDAIHAAVGGARQNIQASKAGAGSGSAEIASLPRPASETAVPTKAEPLILYGYPGCEACVWIRQQFDAKGIPYTYRSVAPVAGVTYPHATRDGKHFNYTELKELLK